MPSHAPAVPVALLPQPIMAQHLRIEIMRLKRRVMYVKLRALEKEEAVVVDRLVAAIKADKCVNVPAFGVVDQLKVGPDVSGRNVTQGLCHSDEMN